MKNGTRKERLINSLWAGWQFILPTGFVLVLSFFLMIGSAFAQAALQTRVEVENNRGYGRMILTLPELTKFVDFSVSSEDNVLVLELAEAIELDVDTAAAKLGDYIRIARQDPDGNVLRFALNRDIRVNTMAAGEHLFIDFLPSNWRGELPSIPEEIVRKLEDRAEEALDVAEQNAIDAKKKGKKATMTVRLGRHPTFSRFVFRWNVPYEASFKREKKAVMLTFNRTGVTDLSTVDKDLPPLIRAIKTKKLAKSTIVTLHIQPEAKVRSYFDNDEYIVDVTSEELAKSGTGGASLPFVIGGLPPVAENARDLVQTDASSGERKLAELPKAPEVLESPRDDTSARQITSADGPDPETDKPKTNEQDRAERTEKELKEKMDREEAALAKKNVEAIDDGARKFPGLSTVRAAINNSQDAVRLVFPFEKNTAAAVFRRGKAIWTVFKTTSIIDATVIEALKGDFIRDVEVLDFGDYKAIRISLPSIQLASSAVDENNWIVSIGSTVIKASTTLSVSRLIDDEGSLFLNVPLDNARGELIIEDPVVGDHLHVVVADPPSRGLVRQQSFVNLRILPSTHALAFSTNDDDVKTQISDSDVFILSKSGLSLSPTKNLRASGNGTFTNDEWYDLPLETAGQKVSNIARLSAKERQLTKNVLEADEESRPRRRMELAQFYASNGFGVEALAALKRAVDEQKILSNKAAFILTKAAAEIAMGRDQDALKTLASERFAKNQDAALWRTIAANNLGKQDIALANAALGRLALSGYDAVTKQAFFLAASDAALYANDLNSAKNFLASVILDDTEEFYRGRYDIQQGKLARAEQRDEDAGFFFSKAIENPDVRIMAEARLHKIILDHETGVVSRKQTVEELERFVAVWRKDNLELTALRKLGQLLAEEKEYRRAFQLVEVAIISNNESPITYALQDEMKEVFLDLFHKGDADELPTIESLSLYYDFRDLMPIGRVGDEIVRYLASRLIDLDLLAQAAELLEHQVEQRLKGAARAKVAADLAVVHLLDDKPHRAITTLRKSQTANLPATLRRQRLMIEGFAIAQNGKVDVALELLQPLNGEDVNRLRANINWDAGRWQEAGRLLEKNHSGRWADQIPLEPEARLDIMRAAIAFALAKDDFALNRLNQKFGEKMAESPDAPTFQILVQPLEQEDFERDVTVDNILSISSQDTFLEDYRRRYFGRTRNPTEA